MSVLSTEATTRAVALVDARGFAGHRRVGGLSLLERALRSLGRAGPERILVVHAEDAPPRLPADLAEWVEPIAAARLSAASLPAEAPLVALVAPAVVDPAACAHLVGRAAGPGPALAFGSGSGGDARTLALVLPARDEAARRALLARLQEGPAEGGVAPRAFPADAGTLESVDGPGGIRSAEKRLYGSLRRKTDGFLAFWFDRRVSAALSRRLVDTRITPNQVSLLTLVPALSGAVLIAFPGRLVSALGALLFLASTILDGCDGELARLRFQESPRGARLDLLCDNVALVALFSGIVVHAALELRSGTILLLGAAIVIGILLAAVIEYLRILRPRIDRRSSAPAGPRVELYERLASRDFAYLLPIMAAFGVLHWFVWATAIGVNLFWIVLATVVARGAATGRGRAPVRAEGGPDG